MDSNDFMPSDDALRSVRAAIETYEAERKSVQRKALVLTPIYAVIVLLLTVLLAIAFNSFADANEQWRSTPHIYLYIGAAVVLSLAHHFASAPVRAFQQSTRERLLPVIFGFIDRVRYRKGATPDSVAHIPKETIGGYTDVDFDDEIAGMWQGWPFELYEARFTIGRGRSRSTVFRGVVIASKTGRAFPGVLIASRRANAVTSFFRGVFGGGLQEVKSGDPFLNETYEFQTDNPDAASALVAGRLTQALKWLGETWPDEPARIALQSDDVFLLLPQSKNFFELPAISEPLDFNTHIAPMIADMASMLATGALVRKIGEADGP